MQEFYDCLDRCNETTTIEARATLEAGLWARFGTEQTVLVLDMAGFTTKVQTHGLLFFLRKIRYMQKTVGPLLTQWNGRLVKFEADNVYAVFTSSLDAVRCALSIHEAFHNLTNGLPDVDNVVVSIGIARGRILMIPGHDFFGDAVNLASKLGEDLAGHRETFISADLLADVSGEPGIKVEPLDMAVGGIRLAAARVSRIA